MLVGQSISVFDRPLQPLTFVVFMLGASSLTRGRVRNLIVHIFGTLLFKSRRIRDHKLQSHLRLSKHRGLGPSISTGQGQGAPVITPNTGFPLCRLILVAGLWCRYSNSLIRPCQGPRCKHLSSVSVQMYLAMAGNRWKNWHMPLLSRSGHFKRKFKFRQFPSNLYIPKQQI